MEKDGRTDTTKRIHHSPHILWWGDKKGVSEIRSGHEVLRTDRRTGTVDKTDNAMDII